MTASPSLLHEDYKALGFDFWTSPATLTQGCQNCLIDVRVAQQLDLSTADLISVLMTMRAYAFLGLPSSDSSAIAVAAEGWRRVKSHTWQTPQTIYSSVIQPVWTLAYQTSSLHSARSTW